MTLIQSALPISNQSIIEEAPSFPSILARLRPLDGTTVQLKPILHQTNLYAHERSGGSNVLVNEIGANTSLETFKVWGIPGTDKYLLQASGNQFLGLHGTALMAISMPGFLEAFEIAQNNEDFTCIRIKASNGRFLQTNADGSVTADANPWPSWSDKDPSIFSLRVTSSITPDSSTIKAIKTASENLKIDWNLLDGARVQLKSIKLGKYLCPSPDDSRTNIGAHQTYAGRWETFKLQRVTETIYQIQFYKESLSNTNKGHEKRFVGLAPQDEHGNGQKVVEIANEPCTQDMFEIVKSAYNPSVVRIRATNGRYLEVAEDELVADNTCSEMQKDEAEDPSVFLMTIITPKEWAYLLKGKDDKDSRPKHLVKAANLRGWLVADSSITPALFDHLEEDVILNGTEIRIKSVKMKKYLGAQHGGGSKIVANASAAKESETFTVWETKEGNFQFLVSTRHFIGLDHRGDCKNVVADSYVPGLTETFKIITSSTDPLRVRIMAACNETFLQADKNGRVSADYTKKTQWRYNDPSVFEITIVKKLRGEFQLTSGLGYVKNEVMADHWEYFIQEEHFKYMFDIGLNAVKIPVGWWIAEDSSDLWPFARGSLQALDNAFDWAEKHDLDVIISLHAPPDSQNGMEQNSSRDSFPGWGRTKESIAKTVKVIEFLSARYGNRSKLYAIDLLDKPAAPGVSLESLKQYYKEGYEAVRRYTSKAYVIMSNRLNSNSKELLKFASGLPRSVLNIHYYDMFSGTENHSLEAELSALTSVQNGPLIFIGDWTVNWSSTAKSERIPIATDDYKRYTLSKLQVLNRASFGWAYWALRIENKEDDAAEEKEDWSLETIVGKDYIKLNN